MQIVTAATGSVGLKEGLEEAKMELLDLIGDYELQERRIERVNDLIKTFALRSSM